MLGAQHAIDLAVGVFLVDGRGVFGGALDPIDGGGDALLVFGEDDELVAPDPDPIARAGRLDRPDVSLEDGR